MAQKNHVFIPCACPQYIIEITYCEKYIRESKVALIDTLKVTLSLEKKILTLIINTHKDYP